MLKELKEAIRQMKITAPDEDKISAEFFKGLSDHSFECLLNIYNTVWSMGDNPLGWISCLIIPILKPGKPKSDTASYRPITLTLVICKIW